MSELRPQYGDTVYGLLYDLVHEICHKEGGLAMPWLNGTEWRAEQPIFPRPLALKGVQLKQFLRTTTNFSVIGFTIEFDGEIAEWKAEQQYGADEATATYLLERSREIYDAHDHKDCIEAFGPRQIRGGNRLARLRLFDGTTISS